MIRPPRVLSIAGTDPTGGAGVQADLKSIAANGGYGMAVVTALVAQNTRGVRSVHTPPAEFLAEQLDAVSDDVAIDAVKIGMLGTVEAVDTVARWLDRVAPPVVVLDPVMVATSGDRLLDPEAERALRELMARADLVTPNVPELAVLADEPAAVDRQTLMEQARRVSERYGVTVVAKGGHLPGDTVVDVLVDAKHRLADGRDLVEVLGTRVDTSNTHGTGCSLSSALATLRPGFDDWEEPLRRARSWLAEALRYADELDVGHGHGPVNHFHGLWQRGGRDTAPTPQEVADDWWHRICGVVARIDALPFVRRLADGTLPVEAFTWYLRQDALYLRDYSRALATASALAPTVEEQEFWADSARQAIDTELALHREWLTDDDDMDHTVPSAVTTAYTNHLLATAARGDYPVLAAALLPCFWIYQDIGDRLSGFPREGHRYAGWLDSYADEGFAAATRRAVAIVTGHAAAGDPATRSAMWSAFLASSEHEHAFFAVPFPA